MYLVRFMQTWISYQILKIIRWLNNFEEYSHYC